MEGRPEWVDDDPRAQALISHLDSEEIEDAEDYWWGLRVYEVDDEHYAVGSSDEVDSAIYEYYNDYSDEDLIEYYDQEGYHLVLRNEKSFIDSDVEDYVYTLSNDELLEISGLDGMKSSLEGYISELVNSLDSEEDSDKIGELSDRIEEAEFKMDNLVEKAKEIVSNSLRGDWENCLSDGAVNCFVHEKGWFSSARELYTSGLVDLDRDGVMGYVTDGADYDVIAPYGYDFDQDDDGNEWVIFKIDY
jgi:DNA-binding transcriptional ArsR family regulator